MGRLVEDMTRLVGEIQALRGSRRAFRKELADGNSDRQMVAKGAKEERLAFCKNLKRTVGGQQREMRAEMAAARRAWAGQQRAMRAEMAPARRARAGQQRGMRAEMAPARRARAGRDA
jgi:hypothetical protein